MEIHARGSTSVDDCQSRDRDLQLNPISVIMDSNFRAMSVRFYRGTDILGP